MGRRRLRARIIRYRRPLAVLCAVIAALCLARIAQPPSPRTIAVILADRNLPAGTVISAADLANGQINADMHWPGISTNKNELIGSTTAHALTKGQPIDIHAIVGPSLLDGLPFTMRALVVLINPSTEHIVTSGDHIDLLTGAPSVMDPNIDRASGSGGGLIASDVVVLATSGSGRGGLLNSSGRSTASMTIAATVEQSLRISQYASSELVVALRNTTR